MITHVRSWCVGSLTYTCVEGLIVHAYVHVSFNNPSLELSHFENRRKLSVGNIRRRFSEKMRQMIGKVCIHEPFTSIRTYAMLSYMPKVACMLVP